MAKAKKNASVALVGLVAIVAATDSPVGYAVVGKDEAEGFVKQGYVEVNPAIDVGEGKLATRITDAGRAKAAEPVSGTQTPAAPAPAFVLENDVAIPKRAPRGRTTGESKYPFAQMNVGQSFFVPMPTKNLFSTVSAANRRFAEQQTDEAGNAVMKKNRKGVEVPALKFTRHFIARPEKRGDVEGTRIWRDA